MHECPERAPTRDRQKGQIMKSAQNYLDEANAVVPKISPQEGIARHAGGKTIFIDVRDSSDIARTGTIAGALRIPRGMIEFIADPASPRFDQRLDPDGDIVVVCNAGRQAALAGRTLMEMGYRLISNVGGISDWKEAGGPTET